MTDTNPHEQTTPSSSKAPTEQNYSERKRLFNKEAIGNIKEKLQNKSQQIHQLSEKIDEIKQDPEAAKAKAKQALEKIASDPEGAKAKAKQTISNLKERYQEEKELVKEISAESKKEGTSKLANAKEFARNYSKEKFPSLNEKIEFYVQRYKTYKVKVQRDALIGSGAGFVLGCLAFKKTKKFSLIPFSTITLGLAVPLLSMKAPVAQQSSYNYFEKFQGYGQSGNETPFWKVKYASYNKH